MEGKKSFADRMERFFAGKGFYIVLFLCVAVFGVCAWTVLSAPAGESGTELGMAVSKQTETAVSDQTEAVTATEAPRAAVTIPEEPAPEQPATVTVREQVPAEQDYYIWPVAGAVENPYSMDALVFSRTMQDWRTHDGVDIAAAPGDHVKAVTGGTVAEIFEDDLLGTTVVLSHRDGLTSRYSNLAEQPTVTVGQRVDMGQVIGAVGDTALGETAEVTHLHFAMALDGISVDPGEYLP